jgi:hypothetical protein
MAPHKSSRRIPPAKRRELEVAAAVAREAVMQLHVSRAVKMIQLATGRVSAVRMLGIYMRLQSISGASADMLANRVLASLGHRSGKGMGASLFVEGEDAEPNQRSWLGVVRDRLRGRVHDDLRRAVELQTGATQVALLELHVRHAQRFVQELSETHPIEAACIVYAQLAEAPSDMTHMIYIMVLDRLAAEDQSRTRRETVPVPVPVIPEERPRLASARATREERKRAEAG